METEKNESKLGLVLSGGGLRSSAQIGVLKVLLEYGIRPDCVIGTSGGAIVAALYASGLSPAEIEKLYLSIIGREGDFIDLSFSQMGRALLGFDLTKVKGLLKGEKIRRYVQENLRYIKNFRDYSRLSSQVKEKVTELYLTAVDINDGGEVVFGPVQPVLSSEYGPGFADMRLISDIPIADAVRSSIGIPGIFTPYAYQGNYYVDGGLRDNLPLGVAVKLAGVTRVIAVDLGYAGLRQEDIVQNGIVDILSQSVDIMSMDQLASDLNDLAIRQIPLLILNPMIYDVSLLETKYIPKMIKRGELLATSFLESRGLKKSNSPELNQRLLFSNITSPILYPSKDLPVYAVFKKQITEGENQQSRDTWWQQVRRAFHRMRQRIMQGISLVVVFTGLILIWGRPPILQGMGLIFVFGGLIVLYHQLTRDQSNH